MTIKEAIKLRHMVRKYTDKPIPADLAEKLKERIAGNNQAHGLQIKLVSGNADGLSAVAKLLLAKNVKNYLVLAGPDTPDLDEKLGYCGQRSDALCSDAGPKYLVGRRYVQQKRSKEKS